MHPWVQYLCATCVASRSGLAVELVPVQGQLRIGLSGCTGTLRVPVVLAPLCHTTPKLTYRRFLRVGRPGRAELK